MKYHSLVVVIQLTPVTIPVIVFLSNYMHVLGTPHAVVGFQLTELTVPEDAGLQTACVVLLRGGPVQMFSTFRVTSRDGTAESAASGEHHYNCHSLFTCIVYFV